MNPMLSAALSALKWRGFVEDARAKLRKTAIAALCAVVAVVLILAALIWADAALWFYYEPRLGAPTAALIAAGAFLIGAIIAGLLALTVLSSGRPARVPPPAPNPLAGVAIPDLSRVMHDNKGTILMAAAIAGLLLSKRK